MLIRPFSGSIVRPDLARRTVTPSAGLLDPAWRRTAALDPLSYLHVVGSGEDATSATRLAEHAAALRRMLDDAVFVATGGPSVVAHRVAAGRRSHTGLLVEVAVAEHRAGRVAGHERVLASRAERFAAHLRTVGATSTPALLVHRPQAALSASVAALTSTPAYLDVEAADGSRHTLWRDDAAGAVRTLTELLAELAKVYVADGHHRIEAAARVAADDPSPASGGRGWFLAYLASTDEVELLAYHRLVVSVARVDHDEIVARLGERARVETLSSGQRPRRSGEVVMCLHGAWYRFALGAGASASAPAGPLDAVALQGEVLSPVLGIDDPTTDPRLEFVPDGPLDALEARCRDEDGAGFLLHPPAVDDVLALADGGQMMPPKSTWFRPKLPSGLVLHLLRDPV